MEPWVDDAARMLEKMTGDPLADAVRGTVLIVAVSERAARGRYQNCVLEVITEAPGVDETRVKTEVVTSADGWPRVGKRLPALISPATPSRVEIDWTKLPGQ